MVSFLPPHFQKGIKPCGAVQPLQPFLVYSEHPNLLALHKALIRAYILPSATLLLKTILPCYLKIKASKTDPFRTGVIIRLTAINNHDLCPV